MSINRFGNLSLSDQELLDICKNKSADSKIKELVKQFLRIASGLKLGNDNGSKIIRDQLETARKVLSSHGDAFADGYFLHEVGNRLFMFAEEIYSQDPEKLIVSVRKRKESIMTQEFFSLFESIVGIHKSLKEAELLEIYRILIGIVDITGVATM